MRTTRTPHADVVAAELTARLDLIDCWYEPFPFDRQLPRIEPGRIVLPATEPGIPSWNLGAGVELPVRVGGLTLGRFVLLPPTLTSGVALSPGDRSAAIAIAERIAPELAAAMIAEEREHDELS